MNNAAGVFVRNRNAYPSEASGIAFEFFWWDRVAHLLFLVLCVVLIYLIILVLCLVPNVAFVSDYL